MKDNLWVERSNLEERAEQRIKEIEEANRNLEESLARFTDIAEIAGDWIWEMDSELRFSYISPRFFEIFPIAREDFIGKTRQEFSGASTENEHWRAHLDDLANYRPFRDFEYETTQFDDQARHILISGKPIFDTDGVFKGYRGTGTDKTAEAEARRALEESEKQFRDLVEGSIQGTFVHEEWNILFANQMLADMLGYESPEEVLALERLEPLFTPEERERLWGYKTARQKGEYAPEIYEARGLKKDGSAIWLELRTTQVDWRGIQAMQCVVIDITERRRAEEKLQEQNERFNAALSNMSQGLAMFDAELRLIVCNERFASIYGLSLEQMKPGITLRQIIEYRIASGAYSHVNPDEYIKERLGWVNRGERESKIQELCNGRAIAITHQPMASGGWVATHEDVTEQKKAERLLEQQAESMVLLNSISVAANQSENVEDTLGHCFDQVCKFTGWEVGHAYVSAAEGSEGMEPSRCWYTSDDNLYGPFRKKTERTLPVSGIGLVGQVMEQGEPYWTADVTLDPNFARAAAAKNSGLKGGVAFPVKVRDEVAAVLEFYAREPMEPSAQLIDILTHVAAQVGQVVERQRSKKKLTDQNERFNAALENMSQGLVMFDAEQRLIVSNKRYASMYGLSREQVKPGTTLRQVIEYRIASGCYPGVNPDEYIKERFGWVNRGERESKIQELSDGRAIAISFQPMSHGGWVATHEDVTERIKTDKALQESQKLFSSLLDNSPFAIFFKDLDGRFQMVNKKFEEWYGINSDEAFGKTSHDLYPEEYASKYVEQDNEVLATKQPVEREAEITFSDGSTQQILITKFPLFNADDNLIGIATINSDITELKLQEQKAIQARELLDTAIEAIDEGFVLYDPDDRLAICNSKYRELYQRSADLIVPGARFEDIIRIGAERGQYPEAIGRVDEWVSERLRWHKECNQTVEQRLGDGRWLRISEHKIPSGGIVGFRIDITALKQAEQAAESARNRFRDYAETASDWLWETGPDSCFTYLSKPREDIRARRSHIGDNRLELFREFNDPDVIERHESDLEARRPFVNFEYRAKGIDGGLVFTQISGKPVFDENGVFLGYRGTGRDITKRKEIERELQHRQKMDALGRLAGGLAHDFNNTLQPITLLSSAILSELQDDGPLREKMVIINEAVTQLASLTKNILSFSRKDEVFKDHIDIHKVVHDAVNLAEPALPSNITVRENLDEDAGTLFANAAQIQSVVLNLVSNAVDSYGGKKGEIDISLFRLSSNESHDKISSSDGVKLIVSDAGIGIPDEDLPKIFEPFYSTKAADKGTGLGLSSAYGIIANYDGLIEVQSRAGHGAKFTVYLPIDEETSLVACAV